MYRMREIISAYIQQTKDLYTAALKKTQRNGRYAHPQRY